jgi:hypothetical protein
MKKQNCWEFMRCGRGPEPNGQERSRVCPAACEQRLDGMNGGENAGRSCWVVAGTLGNNGSTGTIARKIATCGGCDFYNIVRREEYPNIVPIGNLLARLNGEERNTAINPQ